MAKFSHMVLPVVWLVLAIGVFQSVANPTVAKKSFNGHQVIRCFAKTEDEGRALIDLQRSDATLDFWSEPSITGSTDLMVSVEKISQIRSYLNKHNINHEILIPDVGDLIASEAISNPIQGVQEAMDWTSYHSLDTVYEWFQNLTDAYSYIDVINIGKSYEGRDVKVVRLSKNPAENKPAIFIDATIHAREWISLSTVSYIMNELITNPEDNSLLDDVDFYFLPVINPDGYDFTWTSNRMWRKTRSLNGGGCVGADANRNFEFQWSSCSGCSSGACTSETYRGPEPFSEPEAEAMRVFIEDEKNLGVNFQAYISVHSYGQYFMIPWGYTPSPPADYDELQQVAEYVAGNITALYGTRYTTGSSSTTIYPTDGTSQDWAYGSRIFKYVFTAELRDTGSYGFILPANQILPTGEETWAGFKVVAKHIVGK